MTTALSNERNSSPRHLTLEFLHHVMQLAALQRVDTCLVLEVFDGGIAGGDGRLKLQRA